MRTSSVEEFLVKENAALRQAGCKLAEAALYVAREYDGVHRLLLAVSEWSKTVADEGGRGMRTLSDIQDELCGIGCGIEETVVGIRNCDKPMLYSEDLDYLHGACKRILVLITAYKEVRRNWQAEQGEKE